MDSIFLWRCNVYFNVHLCFNVLFISMFISDILQVLLHGQLKLLYPGGLLPCRCLLLPQVRWILLEILPKVVPEISIIDSMSLQELGSWTLGGILRPPLPALLCHGFLLLANGIYFIISLTCVYEWWPVMNTFITGNIENSISCRLTSCSSFSACSGPDLNKTAWARLAELDVEWDELF